jgi:hypothetical protein
MNTSMKNDVRENQISQQILGGGGVSRAGAVGVDSTQRRRGGEAQRERGANEHIHEE